MSDQRQTSRLMRPDRLSTTQKSMYVVSLGLSLCAAFFVAFALSTVSTSMALVYAAFIAVAAFGFGLSWLLVKFQSPPVTCSECGAKGWIEDLTPADFFCPVCNGDAFTYRRPRTTRSGHQIVPRNTEFITGKALVTRAKGKFWD